MQNIYNEKGGSVVIESCLIIITILLAIITIKQLTYRTSGIRKDIIELHNMAVKGFKLP